MFTRALIIASSILPGIILYACLFMNAIILPNIGQSPPQAYQVIIDF